jgi:hypothetical protein
MAIRSFKLQMMIETRRSARISQHCLGRGSLLRFWQTTGMALALISLAPAQDGSSSAAPAKRIGTSQQAAPTSTNIPHKNLKDRAPNLEPNTNVISIQYHCAKSSAACSITVTGEQFHALVQALDPNMDEASRQSLAAEYSRLLIMAAEARRRHLDRSPELQTLLAFSKLQLLANRLVRDITVDPVRVSELEVEKYFRDHRREYHEVTLSRIFIPIPLKNMGPTAVSAADRAAALHKRAIAGEDFELLQREVSETPGGSNGRIGPLQCRLLPEAHREACDLEPGKTSMPQADSLGYSIYRMESRRSSEFDDVRDEIRAMLERQRVEAEIHQVRTPVSLELDERYFGKLPQPAPDLAIKHGMHYPTTNGTAPSKPKKQHHH